MTARAFERVAAMAALGAALLTAPGARADAPAKILLLEDADTQRLDVRLRA